VPVPGGDELASCRFRVPASNSGPACPTDVRLQRASRNHWCPVSSELAGSQGTGSDSQRASLRARFSRHLSVPSLGRVRISTDVRSMSIEKPRSIETPLPGRLSEVGNAAAPNKIKRHLHCDRTTGQSIGLWPVRPRPEPAPSGNGHRARNDQGGKERGTVRTTSSQRRHVTPKRGTYTSVLLPEWHEVQSRAPRGCIRVRSGHGRVLHGCGGARCAPEAVHHAARRALPSPARGLPGSGRH
jgi:hypothetical protein